MKTSVPRHNLTRLRLYLELPQREFADLVETPVTTIKATEVGKLVLSEEIAIRVEEATGVNRDWLLNNDLNAPIVSRSDSPYDKRYFVAAQVCKSDGSYPDVRAGMLEYAERLVILIGQLCEMYLSLAEGKTYAVDLADARVRRLIADLDSDFELGIEEKLEGTADPVSDGIAAASFLVKLVRAPDRQEMLNESRENRRAIEVAIIEEVGERIAGVPDGQLPGLIQQMRAERAASYADEQKEQAQRRAATHEAIRQALLSEMKSPAPKETPPATETNPALELYRSLLEKLAVSNPSPSSGETPSV